MAHGRDLQGSVRLERFFGAAIPLGQAQQQDAVDDGEDEAPTLDQAEVEAVVVLPDPTSYAKPAAAVRADHVLEEVDLHACARRSRRAPLVRRRLGLVHLGAAGSVRETFLRRTLRPFDGVEKMHGDVLYDDVVAAVLLHAVVDHDVAVGAGDGDSFGAGAEQLLRAFGVDLLADALLHPHASAAGTAAHALRAAAGS